MQEQRPHEIRRFADGETIPPGYVELTEEEFELLDPMSVDERAAWLEEHGTKDPFAKLALDLEVNDHLYDTCRYDEVQDAIERRIMPPARGGDVSPSGP